MLSINNFDEAHEALKKYISASSGQVKYTLENIKKFMDYLGNPQDKIKVVHVAGTSGKTSTCYYIASLLTKSGYKTGLTISPHIDQINERVQINMTPLNEAEYCGLLEEFLELVEHSGLELTHFEVMVAFAYWVFDRKNVDYAVVEVGLGGLLDGTNVISRADKLCVITDIGLDHTEILGNTLAEIASQKAGIILDSNYVFMNHQTDEVEEVVRRICMEKNANLQVNSDDYLEIDSLPDFQKRNISLAISCVNSILLGDEKPTLNKEIILDASEVYIPGRMEAIDYQGKKLILDGSHSHQKVRALVDYIKKKYPEHSVRLLVGFGQNKQPSVVDSLQILRELGESIVVTCYSGGQDEIRKPIDTELLADYARSVGFTDIMIEKVPRNALELFLSRSADLYLVTGSLYLLNNLHGVVVNATE